MTQSCAWPGFLFCLLVSLTNLAAARTHYVDASGSDTFAECPKSAPCETITHALGLAMDGDRILVGPGSYPGEITVDLKKLRLLSTHGAEATRIVGDENLGDVTPVITVLSTASGARIGQNGKGFSIFPGDNNDSGFEIEAEKVRAEGNDIFSAGSVNNYGIQVKGSRSVVRYNRVFGFVTGISIDTPTFESTRHNLSGNLVKGANDCLFHFSGLNSRDSIVGNEFTECVDQGVLTAHSSPSPLPADSGSKDRIHDNIIQVSPVPGGIKTGLYVTSGNPIVTRNIIQAATEGIFMETSDGAVLDGNLIVSTVAGGVTGLRIYHDVFNLTLKNNTFHTILNAIHFRNDSASMDGDELLKAGSRNNFMGISCPLGFDTTDVTGVFDFNANFWDNPLNMDGLPFMACDPQTSALNTGGNLSFSPKLIANPIKYRGRKR